MLTKLLFRWVKRYTSNRPCDLVIDKDYMERWCVIPRNRFLNVYIHYFYGSDADIPHDHPWFSFGWLLDGQYREHTLDGSRLKKAGSITFRSPRFMHWIEIDKPVYTLFITGPKVRDWGFLCDKEWVSHERYIERRGPDRLANGCGEFD